MAANSRDTLRDKLSRGEKVIATFTVLRGARNAQVLAHTGVDAVVVDCEHGYIADIDMHDSVLAIAGAGVSPVIRTASDAPETIKRALDTGAHGILVPMISTATQARDIVRLSKFPPVGIRGQGGPFACFAHGLGTPKEYVEQANERVMVIMQIETAEGVENIDEICSVDGVYAVLIGPNDLALALLGRHPAQSTDTVYHRAVTRIREAAQRHGKKAGMVVVDGQGAKEACREFDFVIMTNEVRALQAWYERELGVARDAS